METCAGLDYEILIADDASYDGCIEETQNRFPQVRIVRHEQRLGPSPTKDLGAREARGDVLVFLDGHTKPEPGAVRRLVESVEWHGGNAIITPVITGLDVARWKPVSGQIGHGYFLELERFDCGWLSLSDLKKVSHRGRTFYESPAAIGCAFAVHRELYDDLRGFDPHMQSWGVEDLDFSLKCWLLGHPILHDPEAIVAHRFRQRFDNYHVPIEDLITNQLRMAYKNFTSTVWREWVERFRHRQPDQFPDHPEGLWAYVWQLFDQYRDSAEAERSYLMFRRQRDEFWYAERFGLGWPRLQAERVDVLPRAFETLLAASPSPPPCGCKILRDGEEITNANRDLLLGESVNLELKCDEGTITEIKWTIPGKTFEDYTVEFTEEDKPTSATLTNLTAGDLKANPIKYYWADTGENREIKVDFKLNGKECRETVTLNVKSPQVNFPEDYDPPPIETTSLNANKTKVGLFPEPGIDFRAKVTVPMDFSNGKWHYVQLVTPNHIFKFAESGNCYATKQSTTSVLDTKYPYNIGGSWTTGDEVRTTSDTPASGLLGFQSQNVGDDSFEMYIMFKPAGNDSKWVPLQKVDWEWNFCCTKSNGNWTLDEKGQESKSWKTTSVHPEWDTNITLLETKKVNCPPPCNNE